MLKKTLFVLVLLLSNWLSGQVNPFFGHLGRKEGLAQMTIFSITQDPLGRVWFGTEEGVSRYDGSQVFSIKPSANRLIDSSYYFRGCEIYNLLSTSKGDLYFTADSYLVHYDAQKDRYKQYDNWSAAAATMLRDTLYFNKVRSNTYYRWDAEREIGVPLYYLPVPKILETHLDSDGSLWVGTVKGLFYLRKGTKVLKRIIPEIAVSCYLRTSTGEMWVGSLNHGVFCIDQDFRYRQMVGDKKHNKGLKSNKIHALAQNSDGSIWVGSSHGLYRYNQLADEFEGFFSNYKEGALISSTIRTLYCDRQGRLWIGTASGGVSYMNPSNNSLSYYPFNSDREDSLSGAIVVNIIEDKKGVLWLTTDGGGLNCIHTKTGKVRHFRSINTKEPMPEASLRGIAYDKENNSLYIASRHNGIYHYDITRDKFSSVTLNCPNRPNIHKEEISPLVLHQSYLYFATLKAVYRHSLVTGKTEVVENVNSVEFITISSQGELCFLLSNRIYRIHTKEIGKPVSYDAYPLSIYVSFATFIAEDDDQTFIVGTYSDGLMRFDPKTKHFTPFLKYPNDRVSDYCYKIARLQNGNWIITGDQGIAIVNSEGEVLKTYLPNSGIPVSSLTRQCALHITNNGETYIAGVKGVTALQLSEKTHADSHLYLSNLYVNDQLIRPGDDTHILDKALPFVSSLRLANNQNSIRLSVASNILTEYFSSITYEYMLVGFDHSWMIPNGKEIVYTNLPAGSYTLKVRSKKENRSMLSREYDIALPIVVKPIWYQTWWAWTIWIGLTTLFVLLIIWIATMRRRVKRRLRRELEKRDQIKTINEDKLKFFTNISHEFRTPLTLISGQIDLFITHPNTPSSLIKRLAKTQEQVNYMNQLISQLLDFRKFDMNAAKLNVGQYNLNELLNTLCEPFQEMAIKYQINFSIDLPNTPCLGWIDVEQMRKVIVNLLSNALKFTPNNGTIALSLKNYTPHNIQLTLTNTGTGIPFEEQKHLFEQFYQAHSTRPLRGSCEGTGIGLALCRKIVELHGGTIEVSSIIDHETSFIVTLPSQRSKFDINKNIQFVKPQQITENKCQIIIDDTDNSNTDPSLPKRQFRILIVEDNTAILDTLKELFSPFYEVTTAQNGEEGYIKCKETSPHLVVSDVLMPVKNGYELCSQIKENIETSHIPVILLTALGLIEHNLKGLQSGADDYLAKPFHSKLLLARVGNLIRNRELMKKRYHQKPQESIELLATTPLDKQFLQRAETIVATHSSDEKFDVIQFAQQLAVSRSTLFSKFKALTGSTPNDFIRSQKLRLAAEYLKANPETPLKLVSEQFGFSSTNYFSKCFRQQFGVSPKEYSIEQSFEIMKEDNN